MLGASLFSNRHNRVHISLLPALRDVEEIARFDWGGAALGTCYAFMGSFSRGAGVSLGGYWRVWELWTYEVIGMYPPETTCPNDMILPRALRWSKEYRGVKKGKGNLNAFRLFLDELRPDQVSTQLHIHFMTFVPILIQSGCCYRLLSKLLRLDTFRVPRPLPALVQRTDQYTRRDVEQFTQPDPELEPFFQAGAGYAADYAKY
ncbi:hypothetical protein RHMOL_Rhmol10G0166400 [Rhododendron molle]|uniref:Uncharacterized protein n=1 Tax=Rhododendron molle TaxID=49168 RepID=A0ACC0M3J0_RHOML|nr:hypothetical protein RHMOL_Rhmol10G0166400 [Rhododendron molle]